MLYSKFARTPGVLKNEELSFSFVNGIIVIITMWVFFLFVFFGLRKTIKKKLLFIVVQNIFVLSPNVLLNYNYRNTLKTQAYLETKYFVKESEKGHIEFVFFLSHSCPILQSKSPSRLTAFVGFDNGCSCKNSDKCHAAFPLGSWSNIYGPCHTSKKRIIKGFLNLITCSSVSDTCSSCCTVTFFKH